MMIHLGGMRGVDVCGIFTRWYDTRFDPRSTWKNPMGCCDPLQGWMMGPHILGSEGQQND